MADRTVHTMRDQLVTCAKLQRDGPISIQVGVRAPDEPAPPADPELAEEGAELAGEGGGGPATVIGCVTLVVLPAMSVTVSMTL